MWIFLKVYYYLNVALGNINIHCNPFKKSIQINYWPQIIYCIIHNTVSIILLQVATYFYYNYVFLCHNTRTVAMFMNIVLFATYAEIMVTTFDSWLKRKRLYKLLLQFKRLYKYFFDDFHSEEHQHIVRKCKHLLYRLLFTSLIGSITITAQGYAYLRVSLCPYARFVKVSNFYFIFMNIVNLFVIINIYLLFVYVYMCGYLLIQRLKKILKDVQIMPNADRCLMSPNYAQLKQNTLWHKRLAHEIKIFNRDIYMLRALALELLSIYQLPLALLLLSAFLNLTSKGFTLLLAVYFIKRNSIIVLVNVVVVLIWNILNLIVFLNIFGLIIDNFQIMSATSSEMAIYGDMGNKQQINEEEGKGLSREVIGKLQFLFNCFHFYSFYTFFFQIEMLVLQCKALYLEFSVCGCFNLNYNTSMAILTAVLLNVICLVQLLLDIF